MPAINVLPKNIADLIAAGEVVERPSSVIKEFVENSIDAGSKNITVEINCGGKTFIRVTDNGCGIERNDVKKAFLSHATSKIKTIDDLDNIGTLGFRGEALASVCAVSKVELFTKTENEEFGTRYVIEGGNEVLIDDAGCPTGTTIIVRDLFYNIPARMKFLKKDVQEGNFIASVLERVALSHPEISFKFIRDGKLQFSTSGNGELKSSVYSVFGKDFCENMLPVEFSQNGITVSGFTAKPVFGKSSRALQVFFVNKRYVKIPLIITALETAYKNSILVGKFPPCVLFIDLPFSAVDVNVHPAKTEVRFFDEKRIFDIVYQAVFSALNEDVKRPQIKFSQGKIFAEPAQKGEQLKFSQIPVFEDKKDTPKTTEYKIKEYGSPITGEGTVLHSPDFTENKTFDFLEDEYVKPKETVKKYSVSFENGVSNINKNADIDISFTEDESPRNDVQTQTLFNEDVKQEQTDIPVETEKTKIIKDVPEFRLVGEAFKTYIFAELEGKLLLIDKHAAHERILFNKIKENASSTHQLLLQPAVVSLSAEEYDAVLENVDVLADAGFEVSDFGNRTVKVASCPAELCDENIESLITEIAGYLASNIKTVVPEKLDWIYHSSACRAAVKAGNDTSFPEMEHLIKYLLEHDEIKCCPHGRPVAVEITKYELEKYFKRIV